MAHYFMLSPCWMIDCDHIREIQVGSHGATVFWSDGSTTPVSVADAEKLIAMLKAAQEGAIKYTETVIPGVTSVRELRKRGRIK